MVPAGTVVPIRVAMTVMGKVNQDEMLFFLLRLKPRARL